MSLEKQSLHNSEDHWLSVSDLMAGLMMVFLFISIALMREAVIEKNMIKDVAIAYQENQVAIYEALHQEFKNDLKEWEAELNKENLTFTFTSPETLFKNNESKIQEEYQKILKNFFPRYLNQILKFKDSIDEVRIEGHTSTSGGYFYNMRLSQDRTRTVLKYVYNLKDVTSNKEWIKKHIAAVGFSSSKIIIKNDKEDENASRRVSFRVITNSEIQIRKILEQN